jgi:hypothetical protein
MRSRQIVKRGGSYYIKLAPVDLKDFDLWVGDFINLSEIIKVKSKLKQGGK